MKYFNLLLIIFLASGCVTRHASPSQYYPPQSAIGNLPPVYSGDGSEKLVNVAVCERYQRDLNSGRIKRDPTTGWFVCEAGSLKTVSGSNPTADQKLLKRAPSFNRLYAEALASRDDFDLVSAYLNRGMVVNISTCNQYLARLEHRQRQVEFGRDQALLAGLLTTGVLALAGSTGDAVQGVALGSAFVVDSINLTRDRFLLGPAPRTVSDFISSKMDSQRTEILKQINEIDKQERPRLSFDEAFRLLSGHAQICTPEGITDAIEEVLSQTDFVPENSFDPAQSRTARQLNRLQAEQVLAGVTMILTSIKSDFGLVSQNDVAIVCAAVIDKTITELADGASISDNTKMLLNENGKLLAPRANDLRTVCRSNGATDQEIVAAGARVLRNLTPEPQPGNDTDPDRDGLPTQKQVTEAAKIVLSERVTLSNQPMQALIPNAASGFTNTNSVRTQSGIFTFSQLRTLVIRSRLSELIDRSTGQAGNVIDTNLVPVIRN